MTPAPSTDPQRLKKLRFRAWRRGFRELDLVMGGFADTHGPGLSDRELSEFEALLDEADQDVYTWIIGQAPIPPRYATPLMARLTAYRPSVV